MSHRVREKDDFDEEYTLNPAQTISVVIFTIFICAYLFIIPFREWLNLQFSFVIADWQITFAVICLFFLTLGWYLAQALALFIVWFHMKAMRSLDSKKVSYVRYTLVTYFFTLLFIHYFFGFPFNELVVWVLGFFITATLIFILIFALKMKDSKKEFQESPITSRKPVKEYVEINCLLFVGIIISISFVIFAIWTDLLGVTTFLIDIWNQILGNLFLTILFSVIFILTILWKPLQMIGKLLFFLIHRVLTEMAKRKINRYRFLFGVFIVVMLITANLPYLGLDPLTIYILSLIFGLFSSLLGFFLLRKFKPLG